MIATERCIVFVERLLGLVCTKFGFEERVLFEKEKLGERLRNDGEYIDERRRVEKKPREFGLRIRCSALRFFLFPF